MSHSLKSVRHQGCVPSGSVSLPFSMIPANSLLPCKVIYSQISRIWVWTSLGATQAAIVASYVLGFPVTVLFGDIQDCIEADTVSDTVPRVEYNSEGNRPTSPPSELKVSLSHRAASRFSLSFPFHLHLQYSVSRYAVFSSSSSG